MCIRDSAHIDHVLGVEKLKNKYGIPFALHRLDEPLLRAVKTYAPNYGFPTFAEPEVERWLLEGETVDFGNSTLDILFVPGHAPGHVAFVHHTQKFVIGGDVLFRQSIGRTDLPGGDMGTLLNSIRTQLFTLPDDYTVYACLLYTSNPSSLPRSSCRFFGKSAARFRVSAMSSFRYNSSSESVS